MKRYTGTTKPHKPRKRSEPSRAHPLAESRYRPFVAKGALMAIQIVPVVNIRINSLGERDYRCSCSWSAHWNQAIKRAYWELKYIHMLCPVHNTLERI